MSWFLLFVFMKLHQRSKTLSSVAFILKELIQNAEDAGASEVKFMYDETEYGVESLWSPDMVQHQGEAVKQKSRPPFFGIKQVRSSLSPCPCLSGRCSVTVCLV